MHKLPVLPAVVSVLAGVALAASAASGANAAIIDLGSTSPLNLGNNVSGLTTLVFSPSPDTDTKLATDPDFSSLFLPQNSTQIMAGVQMLFPTVTNLTFIPGGSGVNAGAGTFMSGTPFNFAAVHQGQAEIVFEFATAQTSITFGPNTPQLSGINFFSGVVPVVRSAIPEPSTWAMMLIGFLGLGFAFRQSRRKVSFSQIGRL